MCYMLLSAAHSTVTNMPRCDDWPCLQRWASDVFRLHRPHNKRSETQNSKLSGLEGQSVSLARGQHRIFPSRHQSYPETPENRWFYILYCLYMWLGNRCRPAGQHDQHSPDLRHRQDYYTFKRQKKTSTEDIWPVGCEYYTAIKNQNMPPYSSSRVTT
jgi:hypothetical protein